MLYQKMLTGDEPYFVSAGDCVNGFQMHRHPEVEFFCCIDGSFEINIGKVSYTLVPGDMALISPMSAHGLPENDGKKAKHVVVEVGHGLLHKNFEFFSHLRFKSPVVHIDKTQISHQRLAHLWEETYELIQNPTDFSHLHLTGNIYKICGYILSEFTCESDNITKNLKAVVNIEKALDMINSRYAEPLTVDMAAEVTGYGKSNFCKIFKSITGDTFHNVLNRHRIENACIYLTETAMSVSDIAYEVGFADAKSFCRVFKAVMGMTAGEYRLDKYR